MPSRFLCSPARWARVGALVCAGLVLPSCQEDEQFGTLTIRYGFAGISRSCVQADIATIRATLDGEHEHDDICDLNAGITLTSIPARAYAMMTVEGVNAEGITVMDNLGPPVTDESVEVLGDTTQTVDVQLSPTPAQIRFSFSVLGADGLPYAPQEVPVIRSFYARALENDGTLSLRDYEFVYAQLASVRNLVLPDPMRQIADDDVDALTVEVYAQDNRVLSKLEFQFVPPGPGRFIDVYVECRGEICTGSVAGVELITS